VDPAKDQSYVLGVLTQEQLAHAFFPLGDTVKTEVRAEAEQRGLSVAAKPDSHDICFIADGNTAGFLGQHLGEAPGDIVDAQGNKLGSHQGTHGFTIGQRKGLKIGTPAADGKPRFVLDISPVDRTVTVGSREELAVSELTASKPRWCGPEPTTELHATAQLRAHGEEVAVTATVHGDQVRVSFDEPTAAVAPGQAVVLYDGTRVIGSATIDAVQRVTAAV
jgi:tRNA-specific 2-thiouridylase